MGMGEWRWGWGGVGVGGGGCTGPPLQTPNLLPFAGWVGPHGDRWAFLRGLYRTLGRERGSCVGPAGVPGPSHP